MCLTFLAALILSDIEKPPPYFPTKDLPDAVTPRLSLLANPRLSLFPSMMQRFLYCERAAWWAYEADRVAQAKSVGRSLQLLFARPFYSASFISL